MKLLVIASLLALAAGPLAAQDYQLSSYESMADALQAKDAEIASLRQQLDDALGGNGGCCCLTPAGWFDPCCCGPTWSFSLNGDGWKDASEFTYPDNFGNRFALDATWDLGSSGMRGHLGGAYGLYDYHGRDTEHQSSAEQQVFLTAGVYHRASGCCGDQWTWAAAYDYLHDNHYGMVAEPIELHQVRFLVGRMMNPCNEFGVWGALGIADDELASDDPQFPGTVDVQDQVNLYWRRYYDFGGETLLYAGLANPNLGQFDPNTLQSTFDDDLTEVVIGLRGIAPLTCNVGLVGGFHYVIPSTSGGGQPPFSAMSQETWNVTFGVVWVRGCSLPVLPVADNGWLTKRVTGGPMAVMGPIGPVGPMGPPGPVP